MTYRKKLIEVALPLEAINAASTREKSIRHGHPSTLHLWWARRPLAACRAVIFASLVDDPDDPDAPPEFVQACRNLPRGKNAAENDTLRQWLGDDAGRGKPLAGWPGPEPFSRNTTTNLEWNELGFRVVRP